MPEARVKSIQMPAPAVVSPAMPRESLANHHSARAGELPMPPGLGSADLHSGTSHSVRPRLGPSAPALWTTPTTPCARGSPRTGTDRVRNLATTSAADTVVRGDALNPVSAADVVAKFLTLSVPVLGE